MLNEPNAVLATTDGGRVFVIRDGKVIRTLVNASDDIDISADGSRIVAVEGNVLKYFTLDAALQWSFSDDDRLRRSRLTAHGSRLARGGRQRTVHGLCARRRRQMIDYIHMNPVRRGLCEKPEEWRWSSADWYLGAGEVPIRVDPIPPEWLDDLS